MSSIISLLSRKFPKSSARNLYNFLDKSILEVPARHRSVCQNARIIRRYSIKVSNVNTRTHKSVIHRSDRYFQTSRIYCASQVVKAPPFPESVTEGDARIEKKPGTHVGADEVVMEIETDKTSMPVHAPGAGIIEEFLVKDGQTVKAGTELFRINVTGEAPPAKAAPPVAKVPDAPPPAPKPAAAAPPPPPPPAPAGIPPKPKPKPTPPKAAPPKVSHPPKAAPSSKAPPKPAPVPQPQQPMTSMPVAAIRHAQSLEAATVKLPPQDPTKEISGTRSEQRVKMNRMRLKIAQRLKEAQNTNAMLTTFNEIDMSFIMDFRKQNLEPFQKKYGLKLSFMSAFLKASAYALQDQPVVNAVISGQEIIYRDFVDISVAVATPKGLVVPVIRNVERMNYADIEQAMGYMADKARKGQLAIEDMDGGTFTISNGGVFGSLLGTPIINPPQSAILGMHGIFERPIALKGQVVIRPMMYIALTYDHRLVDGREAVLFLRKIKQGVENPTSILAGL